MGYSPQAGRFVRVPQPFATHGPKDRACDLHALGTPPALILSQDQTRQKDGEAAEQASTIDRAVPGVVDWERRLLHTSVGKVPATQKRVGYRKDSQLGLGFTL